MATGLYEGMGYSVFRVVKDYYGNLGPDSEGGAAEDAYGLSTLLRQLFEQTADCSMA